MWAAIVVFAVAALSAALVLGTAEAAVGVSLEQCRNGADGNTPCDENTSNPLGWVSGNAGHTKARYFEGDAIPYRVVLEDLIVNDVYTLGIGWDTTSGSKHAIDYIAGYTLTDGAKPWEPAPVSRTVQV